MRQAIAVLGLVLLLGIAAGCGGSAAPTPTPTTAPVQLPTPTMVAVVPTPTVAVAPTISTLPPRLMVANTGGEGAMLRKTPGGEAIRGWADGSVMQTVGPDQVASGRTWRNVKDPAGNVGFIAADFLIVPPAAPATAVSTVAPTATKAATPRP